ncbi:MAG: hypothetical protein A3F17_05195 [Gammaproteobacteria bacterium RIFCSPHIGHO2_12_FULL_41_15]|nr:MAG: hypothetical protein A3F17_05195 [Gammaproteobacteria bacterium RIFCSPHIGHO2_12_FULL_41_15]
MGVRKVVGRSIKKKFNVKQWAGADQVVENANLIKQVVHDVFGKNKKKSKTFHSFEDAVDYYKLSPAALNKRRKNSLYSAITYSVGSFLILVYVIYLFSHLLLLGSLTALILSAVAALLGYREHFTFFQLTERRLKASFKEWLQFAISRRGWSL